jgi:hypothetical protein
MPISFVGHLYVDPSEECTVATFRLVYQLERFLGIFFIFFSSLSPVFLILDFYVICLFLVHKKTLYLTPRRTLSQLKKYNFQDRGKTTGRCDAIAPKEQRHFSPLADILENRHVTLFR